MKKLIIPVIAFLVVLSSCNQSSPTIDNSVTSGLHNQLSDAEKMAGWELLFDGQSMDAWRGFKQESVGDGWTVRDSTLVSLGKGGDMGGDIITRDEFEDFELYLEWAISEGGNSGIFFHVLEDNYPTTYASGPEYQLIDDVGFPQSLEEWQKTGANYAMHNASDKKLKPVGEFNSSRIIVNNGRVQHYLNGLLIVDYKLWSDDWKHRVEEGKWDDYPYYGLARKGHIGLQDHGSVIRFRNIKVRDLTDPGYPLFNGANLDGWKIHGTEQWYVDEGLLICESGPQKAYGYLATQRQFKDFILRVQFLQESNGNSGVFFRSSLDGTKISGWQVEVAPPGNNSGAIYESYGRGWLNEIPDGREYILKEGEWNDLVIEVKDNRVMTWLNHELMTDLEDELIGKGRGVIALQIHDGGGVKVKWKNIFIKEIQ
jgi:hypothetical protein